jgi:hypothetical protein
MRERKSEMFEAYAKLAEEKGLVKTAAEEKKKEKESKELKNYRSETYPRVGSDDISTIEALYGVKPESYIKYENNIAEYAHPNAVVVAPSYDKINALVENINERQNIIINKILSKAPSGSSDMFLKDAEKDLAMELIRIGNDMDNADEEELRALADECLDGFKKKADFLGDLGDYAHKAVDFVGGNKGDKLVSDIGGVGEGALAGAASGALVGAIITSWGGPLSLAGAGVGALIGGTIGGIEGYIFNTSPKVKNIKENSADLLNQMGDLKKAVPEEEVYFKTVEDFMGKLVKASNDYITILNTVQSKSIKNEPVTPNEIQEVKNDSKIFIDMLGTFEKIKETFEAKAKQGSFAKAVSYLQVPGVANDIQDVRDSFKSLSIAIDNLKATMTGIVNKSVEEAKSNKAEPTKEEVKPTEVKPTENAQKAKQENSIWDLIGHKPDEDTMKFINSIWGK